MNTFTGEQQEALEIAMRYAVYDAEAWYESNAKDMKRLMQIVYDRPAQRHEHDGTGYRYAANKVVQDAIARTGYFAPGQDWWKVGFYVYTVVSTLLTIGTWAYLYARTH